MKINPDGSHSLVPHDPKQVYTYVGCKYDPDIDPTDCDRLLECLEPSQREIFLRTAAAGLNLKLVRSRLTGRGVKGLLCYGEGSNGKDTLRAVLATVGKIECLSDGNDESLRQELKAANKQLAEWDAELNQLHSGNGDLGLKVQILEQELKEVQGDRDKNKNLAPAVAEFPEAADLLNQLKTRRKKSIASLADIEALLDILENH